jgi:histidinol-phosphate aminotransferase
VHRLDRLGNPFGPSLHVLERLSQEEELTRPATSLERQLVERIADLEGVPTSWIAVGAGADDVIARLLSCHAAGGNLVVFPPTDPRHDCLARRLRLEPVAIPRSCRLATDLERRELPGFPPNAVALVQTPNDPTGTMTAAQDVVRMARRSRLVLVDERHASLDHRSLLPIAREFDNVVIVRSFEVWAGLEAFPVAYALGSSRLLSAVNEQRIAPPPVACLLAALATLDDLRHMRAVGARLRDEKDRLYRMLRKLNLLSPYPSWASFVLVRFERGAPRAICDELAARGILVHRPQHPELAGHARISAVSQEATAALRAALIEIAAEL